MFDKKTFFKSFGLILFCILVGCLVGWASAEENFAYNSLDVPQLQPPINYSTFNSSTAEYLHTDEGLIDNIWDILHSDLDNLAWSVAGHTIDANIDMNSYQLTDMHSLILSGTGYLGDWDGVLNTATDFAPTGDLGLSLGLPSLRWANLSVGDIFGDGSESYVNSTFRIDGDMADGNATLVIEADSSHLACINFTEGNNIGSQLCYDGAGANRAFVVSNLLDGNEWFWIDRITGLITFNNDTVAVSLITETINATDWSNLTDLTDTIYIKINGTTTNLTLENLMALDGNTIKFWDNINATGYNGTFDRIAIGGDLVGDEILRVTKGGENISFFDGAVALYIQTESGIGTRSSAGGVTLGSSSYALDIAIGALTIDYDGVIGLTGPNSAIKTSDSQVITFTTPSQEDLTIDLFTGDNTVTFGSTTGVTDFNFGDINLSTSGDMSADWGNFNGITSLDWSNITDLTEGVYLNLSGTNANQNINITPYNLTTDQVLFPNALDGSVKIGDASTLLGYGSKIAIKGGGISLERASDDSYLYLYNIVNTAGTASIGAFYYASVGGSNQMVIDQKIADADIVFKGIDGAVAKGPKFDFSSNILNLDGMRILATGGGSTLGSTSIGGTLTVNDVKTASNSDKFYWGESDDTSRTFNESDTVENLEVGTDGKFYITNYAEVVIDGNYTGNSYYGEMWYHNHTATELNFAIDGTFYNLTFDNSDVNGFYFNDTGDYLEALVSGKYKVCYMASGDGQNNHVYFTTVLINGADQDRLESHKKMTAGGDIVTMTGCSFLDISIGDEIKLATADIGGTGTGNYYSSNVNLIRIGD